VRAREADARLRPDRCRRWALVVLLAGMRIREQGSQVNNLESSLRELHRSPVGQVGKSPGKTLAVCPRCRRERWVTADGLFAYHNDDNDAWCNGSREAVRT